jgi:hypothetical protein
MEHKETFSCHMLSTPPKMEVHCWMKSALQKSHDMGGRKHDHLSFHSKSTDKDSLYWVHFSLSLSFIPRDLQICLAGRKLSQRFSFNWSSPWFPPTSPRVHQEHRDLLDKSCLKSLATSTNHSGRVWSGSTLEIVWYSLVLRFCLF